MDMYVQAGVFLICLKPLHFIRITDADMNTLTRDIRHSIPRTRYYSLTTQK